MLRVSSQARWEMELGLDEIKAFPLLAIGTEKARLYLKAIRQALRDHRAKPRRSVTDIVARHVFLSRERLHAAREFA